MGIEYVIEQACPVRDALGGPRMVQLVKWRNQARAAVALQERKGEPKPPAEIKIRSVLHTPEGKTVRETDAQSLLDESEPLRPLETHCPPCCVNVAQAPFGCFGSIAYPIRRASEEALLSLLPRTLDCTAGQFLRSALADFHMDGARAATLRGHGGRFFESAESARRDWSGWWTKYSVDFNQMFELIFTGGKIEPAHGFVLCLILGVIDQRLDAREIVGLMHDADRKREMLLGASMPRTGEGEGVAQFATFLEAVRRAAAHEVTVWIDA